MLDLFDGPVLPGLATARDFVTEAEERFLTAAINAAGLAPFQFQGWTGKRLTVAYGWSYDFETGRMAHADPLPAWLLPFRDRAARLAGLVPEALAQALLLRYDRGSGIGWHKDRLVFGHVIGISLGAPAAMRFRRRRGGTFLRAHVPLEPRGAYHLSGEARHAWEHSIAEMDRTRWSLTFRSLAN